MLELCLDMLGLVFSVRVVCGDLCTEEMDATRCGWGGVGGILPFLELTPLTCYGRFDCMWCARLLLLGLELPAVFEFFRD